MNLDETNTVGVHDTAPAGNPALCFWCDRHVGDEHEIDCVRRLKVVMVKVTMTIPRTMPQIWDGVDINESMAEDGDNPIRFLANDLVAYVLARTEAAPPVLDTCHMEYLRDATPEDLLGLHIDRLIND